LPAIRKRSVALGLALDSDQLNTNQPDLAPTAGGSAEPARRHEQMPRRHQ